MKTSLSFVGYCDNSFTSIMDWDIEQELRNVACTKHSVNSCKSSCSLLGREVRCEYTIRCTLPPQELACAAWWTCSCRCAVTGRCHRWKNKVMNFVFFAQKERRVLLFLCFFFRLFFFLLRLDFWRDGVRRLEEVMIWELGSSEMCTSKLGNGDGWKWKEMKIMMEKCLVSLGGFYKRNIMRRENSLFSWADLFYMFTTLLWSFTITYNRILSLISFFWSTILCHLYI